MGGSSGVGTSSPNGYEPMASALVSVLKVSSTTCSSSGKHEPPPGYKDTIIYENCFQCKRGQSGCMATGINKRDRGRVGDPLLVARGNCNTGSTCHRPFTFAEDHRGERGQGLRNQPKEVSPELGISLATGAHSDEVSHGSVEPEEGKEDTFMHVIFSLTKLLSN